MKNFITTLLYLCLLQTKTSKLISNKYYGQNLSNFLKRRNLENEQNNLVQNENPFLQTQNPDPHTQKEIESQEILNPFKSETPEIESESEFEKFENPKTSQNTIQTLQDLKNYQHLENEKNLENQNKNKKNEKPANKAIQNLNTSSLSPPVKSLLTKTLQNTNGENPIILINHSPTITSYINPQTHYTANPQNPMPSNFPKLYSDFKNAENPENFSNNQIVKFNAEKWKTKREDFVSAEDIDVLVRVLSDIWDIYQRFFAALPEREENGKGAMGKTMGILRFYAKMRNFVKIVFLEKDELFGDVRFLESRVSMLRFEGEEDMVRFYDLGFKYDNLKARIGSDNNRSSAFLESQAELQEINEKFEIEIKSILSSAYDLSKLNQFFTNEIEEITKNSSENDVLNALDKFDKILMMTIRVIELKIEIEQSVGDLKEGIEELKKYRVQVEDVIIGMEKSLEGKVVLTEGLVVSFGGAFRVFVVVFLLVF